MAANTNPSYDLSALVLLDALAAKMAADQAAGVSSFVGGNEIGKTPQVGRITASYNAVSGIPPNVRTSLGVGGIPTSTVETTSSIENRIEAALTVINQLAH